MSLTRARSLQASMNELLSGSPTFTRPNSAQGLWSAARHSRCAMGFRSGRRAGRPLGTRAAADEGSRQPSEEWPRRAQPDAVDSNRDDASWTSARSIDDAQLAKNRETFLLRLASLGFGVRACNMTWPKCNPCTLRAGQREHLPAVLAAYSVDTPSQTNAGRPCHNRTGSARGRAHHRQWRCAGARSSHWRLSGGYLCPAGICCACLFGICASLCICCQHGHRCSLHGTPEFTLLPC